MGGVRLAIRTVSVFRFLSLFSSSLEIEISDHFFFPFARAGKVSPLMSIDRLFSFLSLRSGRFFRSEAVQVLRKKRLMSQEKHVEEYVRASEFCWLVNVLDDSFPSSFFGSVHTSPMIPCRVGMK